MNHRNTFLSSAFLFAAFAHPATAQDTLTYYQQPVVITADRTPKNSLYVGRSIEVIDGDKLRQPGTMSVEDALRNWSDVCVQSRGLFGVQTDISIRGSLFSQSLVLLNGIPINDPQTAHHDFDIPIPTTMLGSVEILKGPGSAHYGSSAYGGVVNIITQEPRETNGVLSLSAGNYGLLESSGSISIVAPRIRTTNAVEYRRSEGYRFDTEFSVADFTTNTIFDLPFGSYALLGGFTKKTFGAFDFYSPGRNVPSKEWTETGFLSLSTSWTAGSFRFAPRAYYRSHLDRFMYDIRIPDKYVNTHRTTIYGGELVSQYSATENLTIVSGLEADGNAIVSNALGNHRRTLAAIYASSHYLAENALTFDAGVRGDYYSAYGWQLSPTVGASRILSSRGKLYATIGRSFRAPSYTELYYSDPSTAGNPDLKPEIGWSYEAGIDYFIGHNLQSSFSAFERDQSNLIDYVQYSQGDISHAVNFTSAKTRGFEFGLHWKPSRQSVESEPGVLREVKISYGYLDSRIDRGQVYSSRYAFVHPKHRVGIAADAFLPTSIHASSTLTYNVKLDNVRYTLLDARLSRVFDSLTLYIKGTNLLNESYEEIVGVPLPGRWLWAGAEYRLF
jgi:vitamin B12 transporter